MSRTIEITISCCSECLYYDIYKHKCRKGFTLQPTEPIPFDSIMEIRVRKKERSTDV